MRLVHQNIRSHTIFALVFSDLVSILAPVTESGGIGYKGDKDQEQDQDNIRRKMSELDRNLTLSKY